MKKRGEIASITIVSLILVLSGIGGVFTFQKTNTIFDIVTGSATQPTDQEDTGRGGGTEVCGNDICGDNENCDNCPGDCGDCCGNSACDYGETCSTCNDCACDTGEECVAEECIPIDSPPVEPTCGDSSCNGDETCSSCVADCACGSGYVCTSGSCLSTIDNSPQPTSNDGSGSNSNSGSPPAISQEETEEPNLASQEQETYNVKTRTTLISGVKQYDRVRINYKDKTYSLEIKTLTDFSIILDNNGENVVIKPGETKEIDLNQDGTEDASISYDQVSTETTNLRVELLEETSLASSNQQNFPSNQQIATFALKSPTTNMTIIYFVVAISALLISLALIKRSINTIQSKKHIKRKN